jgi:hypothetical protein
MSSCNALTNWETAQNCSSAQQTLQDPPALPMHTQPPHQIDLDSKLSVGQNGELSGKFSGNDDLRLTLYTLLYLIIEIFGNSNLNQIFCQYYEVTSK